METPKPNPEPNPSASRNPLRIAQAALGPQDTGTGVGQLLRKHRRASGLSQAFLANHLQVHLRTVKGWESGRSVPRGKKLEYLFHYLDIPLQEVLVVKRRLLGLPQNRLDEFTDLHV